MLYDCLAKATMPLAPRQSVLKPARRCGCLLVMWTRAKSTILGVILAAGLIFPAMAQLDVPCNAFETDDSGDWYATQQVTVDTAIGLIDVTPGHLVGVDVARVLDAVCQ